MQGTKVNIELPLPTTFCGRCDIFGYWPYKVIVINKHGCELMVFQNACGVGKECAKVYYP